MKKLFTVLLFAFCGMLTAQVMPVEMKRFEAVSTPKGVELTWETASEVNASHFDIERSVDGIHFKYINSMNCVGVANVYTYTDAPLSIGQYYRLKQVDKDGKEVIMPILYVEFRDKEKKLLVYPNPSVLGFVTVNADSEATIYDALGRIYKLLNKGETFINDLPKGQFWLRSGSQVRSFIIN